MIANPLTTKFTFSKIYKNPIKGLFQKRFRTTLISQIAHGQKCYNASMNHLIDYFVPEHYDLFLNLDKYSRRFGGTVTITGKTVGGEIRLHARNLKIKSVRLDGNPTDSYHMDQHDELVITGHAHVIRLDFSGDINETDMHGLYLGKYKVNGEPQELLATQFESHYARELFPCVDEPAAKATFTLKIQTAEPVVLSNMPGHHVKNAWEFGTTPRMSTYLLAIVAGDLQKISAKTKRGVDVSIYATRTQDTSALQHALNIATQSIDFYEDYFGVQYPLPKSDHVALPDFSAGAMENWGLITYRETALLARPEDSQETREYVATVIAHELAHQWFGNLVTMQWWNDLWLNESFASLMEHVTVDHLHPEYQIWKDFETTYVPFTLKRDALPEVQVVRQDVNDPAEIDTLFDSAIVYGKGERLLVMLMNYIGEDAFRRGLASYFQQMQYHNATVDDLWQHLSEASGLDVKGLMDNWLTKPGYPIIEVTHNNDEYRLTQHRYLTSGEAAKDDTIWQVPLFADNADFPQLMSESELMVGSPSTKLQLNLGDRAHFITKYDDGLWQKLMDSYDQQDVIDRIKLLRESLMLAQSDHSTITPLLQLLQHCDSEQDFAMWSAISSTLSNLSILLEVDSPEDQQFRQFVERLTNRQWQRLFSQVNAELNLNDQKLRPIILARAIYSENSDAKDYALNIYHQHEDITHIDSATRSTVLSTAVRYDEAFERLFKEYQTSQDANLKQDIAAALTSTKNSSEIRQLLDTLTNTDVIKPQDTIFFTSWLLSNTHARTTAWRWLRDHWDWIRQVFGADMTYDDFARAAGSTLRTESELAEYVEFFTPLLQESALTRTIKLGQTDIQNRIKWIQNNHSNLVRFLTDSKSGE